MDLRSTQKKKIVFLLNDLDVGGVQKSLISLLNYLNIQQQYNMEVFVWEKGGILESQIPKEIHINHLSYPPLLKDIKENKVVIKKIKHLAQYLYFKWISVVRKKPWLYFKHSDNQFDIAISFVHRGYPLYYTIDKINAKKKILWFHHGIYEATGNQKKLDKKYFNQYNVIVPVSESNKLELYKNLPFLQKKLKVISNLIPIEEIINKSQEVITDFPHNGESFNFVTVSRISPEKGIDLALEVASHLKRKDINFRWFFVGDGPLLEEMKDRSKKLNVQDVCIFLGTRSNPYPYIKQADLYIQTSYVEAHPITINEALVLKKIVLATNIPSVQAVLQDGNVGILCDPTPENFSEKIERLIIESNYKELLQERINKLIISNDHTIQKINQILEL